MRTTLELLRYLTRCAQVPATAILTERWDNLKAQVDEAARMPADAFPEAMDSQLDALRTLLEPVSDDEFLTRPATVPWAPGQRLGEALVNTSLKFLTAYRMQLFLYAKIGGAADLATSNCWMGVDMPD